jgi:hypothetical protein
VDWVVGWGCDFDHWICIVVDIIGHSRANSMEFFGLDQYR